jgi:adenine deaminase
MRLAGVALRDALRAATANPAHLLRRPRVCAAIAPGEPANVLVARPQEESLEVEALYLGGELRATGREVRSSSSGTP